MGSRLPPSISVPPETSTADTSSPISFIERSKRDGSVPINPSYNANNNGFIIPLLFSIGANLSSSEFVGWSMDKVAPDISTSPAVPEPRTLYNVGSFVNNLLDNCD